MPRNISKRNQEFYNKVTLTPFALPALINRLNNYIGNTKNSLNVLNSLVFSETLAYWPMEFLICTIFYQEGTQVQEGELSKTPKN